jgi:putative transposase
MKSHRPFHLYVGRIYFITGRVLDGSNVWMTESQRSEVQNILGRVAKAAGIKLYSWVILPNHYHLLCDFGERGAGVQKYIRESKLTFATPNNSGETSRERNSKCEFASPHGNRFASLTHFVRRFHALTALLLNKAAETPGRKVWYQYWDYCIRNKPDFWMHFNYIVQNPLKHKLARTLREAYQYRYSSNPVWLQRFTEAGLSESFEKFPVRDWTPTDIEE